MVDINWAYCGNHFTIYSFLLVLYILREYLNAVLHNIDRLSAIKSCSLMLLTLFKILITLFISYHYHLDSASFLLVSVSFIAYCISYILDVRFSLTSLKSKTDTAICFSFLSRILSEVMFFCLHSLFAFFIFQKVFLGSMCLSGLLRPNICLKPESVNLGPPHCFI